ncbi:riboflavin kinase [Exidia glandulosa HHB12029]|uniref:Riboflavin kinase n=1 Tax=Exidia glandulosa HHB12029 TaxID=1314781 RepID=A0A165QQN3_EXIGL|nr:riboflavin kinase [Exidia glandulosa HHB12029]
MTHTQTAQETADLEHRPEAPVATGRAPRPDIVGGDVPEPPFPIRLQGPVQHGFKRGSKDLGFPTANLPDNALEPITSSAQTGIYFGYAQIAPRAGESNTLRDEDYKVFPMVMSLGFNPYYQNKTLTAEVHILHDYPCDFYGHDIRTIVLGYIRPELNYISREALIEDIRTDIRVGLKSLDRPAYSALANDDLFLKA